MAYREWDAETDYTFGGASYKGIDYITNSLYTSANIGEPPTESTAEDDDGNVRRTWTFASANGGGPSTYFGPPVCMIYNDVTWIKWGSKISTSPYKDLDGNYFYGRSVEFASNKLAYGTPTYFDDKTGRWVIDYNTPSILIEPASDEPIDVTQAVLCLQGNAGRPTYRAIALNDLVPIPASDLNDPNRQYPLLWGADPERKNGDKSTWYIFLEYQHPHLMGKTFEFTFVYKTITTKTTLSDKSSYDAWVLEQNKKNHAKTDDPSDEPDPDYRVSYTKNEPYYFKGEETIEWELVVREFEATDAEFSNGYTEPFKQPIQMVSDGGTTGGLTQDPNSPFDDYLYQPDYCSFKFDIPADEVKYGVWPPFSSPPDVVEQERKSITIYDWGITSIN